MPKFDPDTISSDEDEMFAAKEKELRRLQKKIQSEGEHARAPKVSASSDKSSPSSTKKTVEPVHVKADVKKVERD